MPQVRCHSLADKCARLIRGDGVRAGARRLAFLRQRPSTGTDPRHAQP
jgi:hypothetical protein